MTEANCINLPGMGDKELTDIDIDHVIDQLLSVRWALRGNE